MHSTDRFLKGLLFRLFVEMGLDVAEAYDEEDAKLKFRLFGKQIILYVMEVRKDSRERLYAEAARLSLDNTLYSGNLLALVPDDSAEMVGGAIKVGIDDVILLPHKRERYEAVLRERLPAVLDKGRETLSPAFEKADAEPVVAPVPSHEPAPSVEGGDLAWRTEVLRDLKLAQRGGHTVSLLLIRISGLTDAEIQRFEEALEESLRETDRILPYGHAKFLVACPFTAKPFLVEVERKVHQTYAKLFGPFTMERRVFMYGANYPDEEQNLETLLEIMENGVHDSMMITAIREPLHQLSQTEIEAFRSKMRRYRI